LTLAGPSLTCSGVGVRTWITEPIRTPLSLASVYEASTSLGRAWFGIRPESSLTIRDRLAGGTSKTPKAPVSIGLRQELSGAD
jgi:hypothetical protein